MRDPDALISTDELAGRLGEPELRIYDCTTYLEPPDPGSDDPYKPVAGWKSFVAGHIPGADFLDVQDGRMGEGPEPADRDRLTPGSTLHCRRWIG